MSDLITAIAPFALGGALLLTWTIFIIVLLGTDRPYANALSFIGGNVVFRMLAGTAALLAADLPTIPGPAEEPSQAQAVWLAGGALVALVLGVVQLRKPDDPDRPLPGWMRRFERMRPWVAFLLGVATVAAPGIQYVYLLGGVAAIDAAELSPLASLLALALFVGFLQVMLLAPVIVYALVPARTSDVLDRMKRWISGHTNRVSGGVLVALAVYFGIRAAGPLVG